MSPANDHIEASPANDHIEASPADDQMEVSPANDRRELRGWRGRRVLVTGDTGFKGTWLAMWLQRLGADVVGLGLPPEDPRGIHTAVCAPSWPHHDVDIRDAGATARAVAAAAPDVVLHLAAQALVRRSYRDPAGTYATNVVGTANVLDAVARGGTARAVVVVTSDKVYRQDGDRRPFTEADPLGGHDPYSASKACTELVVAEWSARGGDCAVATARAGNVIGGGDRGEDRLLPDVVRGVEAGEPTRVRNPAATRPWQHVLEPLAGYLALADRLCRGDAVPSALNFGPAGAASVEDVLTAFVGELGAGRWELDDGSHPHEASALALDASLATRTLAWRPVLDLDTALAWTAEWYRCQLDGGDVRAVTVEQLERYEARR